MNLTDNQARLRDALPHADHEGATAADLAEATGLGYSTVTRLLRELAEFGLASKDDATGRWQTAAGAHGDVHEPVGPADAPLGADPGAEHDPAAEPDASSEPAEANVTDDAGHRAEGAARNGQRLRKGALRDLVLAALRDADGQPLGPTELSRRLGGKSQGAIANACDALVATGDAVLTSERPRRFAALT